MLEEDDGFEGFAGAVADRVALLSRAECPRAFSALSVADFLFFAVFSYLLIV